MIRNLVVVEGVEVATYPYDDVHYHVVCQYHVEAKEEEEAQMQHAASLKNVHRMREDDVCYLVLHL